MTVGEIRQHRYLFLLGGEIFCYCFHNCLFSFFSCSFILGNDFISMDQTIPFYGSNSSVVFFFILVRARDGARTEHERVGHNVTLDDSDRLLLEI
jgi:hypothetical protein